MLHFYSIFLLISFSFLQPGEVYAQKEKIDSLSYALDQLAKVKGDLRDTTSVRLHNSLAWEYYLLSSYDTAAYHVQQAFVLLDHLPGKHTTVKKLRADALNSWGNLLTERTAYDSAMQVHQQALVLWEQLDDSLGMANAYNNMGIIHDYRGQFEKSIQHYSRALNLRKAVNNQVGVADAYNNLGVVYHYQGLYRQALENYLLALERYRQAGDLDGVAYIYNNIGLVYQRQEQYQEALASYEDALEIRLELEANQREIGSIYGNIAKVHMDMGNYREALRYSSDALEIFDHLEDHYRRASILNNLGFIYNNLGNIDQAISYAKRALRFKREINSRKTTISTLNLLCELLRKKGEFIESENYCTEALDLAGEVGSKNDLVAAYLNMADINEEKGSLQEALEYLRLHLALQDSLLQEEYSNKIAEMSARYETEKKEQEIILQKAQLTEKEAFIKKQNLLIWGIGISLLLVFVLAAVSFWLYRSQYKSGQIIGKQKVEVEKKNELLNDASKVIKLRNQELSQLNKALTEEKGKVQEVNLNLEQKVLERTNTLSQRNEQLKAYAFFNAHRFRGPVANILGLAHLANSQKYTLEEKLLFVKKMGEAAHLLDLSIHEIQLRMDQDEEIKDEPKKAGGSEA